MIDQKLLTLIAVSKYENFSKAANKLGLTQPAVSTHIKLLEQEFNIKIFNKSDKQLIFTPEGEILLRFAKRMVSLYSLLKEQIEDEKNNIKSLTIGMTHSAENSQITTVLAAFAQNMINEKYKRNIKIISDSIKKIYNKLKTYEIDLAIVEGKFPDKDFNSILLDTDSLVLIASTKNPLAKKNIITINELKKESLILRLPNSDSRKRFEAGLNSLNLNIKDFHISLELDSISAIKNLVEDNYGVAIISKSTCQDEIKAGKIKALSIENLTLTRDLNIIYHENFDHPQIIDELVSIYHKLS